MPWLSWLIQFFKKFLPEEKDNRSLIAQSPNQRSQLYYEVQNYPGQVATFYLVNPTDSRGDIVLYFDDISLLYQEFKRQKVRRAISVRDTDLEKELATSQEAGCNYRLTVIRTWTIQGKGNEKRIMRELKYVIDFKWGIQNQYDSPYRSFRQFASSLLREELPEHRSDWGKYLCDPYAIDWKDRLSISADAKDIRVIFPKVFY
jgi:hypothetical protein